MLDLNEFQKINHERALRWHKDGTREWSTLEWAGAMCGEAGEAANIAKKLLRIELELAGNAFTDHKMDHTALLDKLAQEVADVVIYGSLLLSKHNLNLEAAIVRTFNNKSIAAGFPERI